MFAIVSLIATMIFFKTNKFSYPLLACSPTPIPKLYLSLNSLNLLIHCPVCYTSDISHMSYP